MQMLSSHANTVMGPADLVAGVVELASPPEIYTRITRLLDEPGTSSADFAGVLQEDPALTARLLKIVNSVFYGFPSQINTVSRAITLVGMRELRDLVLTATVLDMFNGLPNELVTMRSFWEESMRCAVFARLIAQQQHQEEEIESIFIAGLLHEVGHLVIYRKVPELVRESILLHKNRGIDVHVAEREVMGFDYAEVGGILLRKWKLPASLCDAVEYHIDPESISEHNREAMIVHMARRMASVGSFDEHEVGEGINVYSPIFKLLGLRQEMLEDMLLQAERQFKDMIALVM
jgi:HD-like signal output (HDOD) protein